MKIGDVFKIKTNIGFGYLQYVETDNLGIDFVRVLEPISANGEITQAGVDQTERWNIGFPLKTAVRRKIVEMVDNFEIPKTFINSEFARSEYNIRGEFLGWHIVHKSTLKRELKSDLDEKNLKLSPHGIMNDRLIVERLEQNWRLENWK
ncbi:hypothetical protein J8J42_06945 [Chryseobacterium sp. cx-311]|uniref:hypothetical protein n=1 Tax=Marnyiella aurantia TaxID=2758037 RepID=UPI001AE8667B|nr:hypothetical protein [Marnyiella aurantia]MBP0612780.1 hypothetical protein [Marnyiella aurantia]